MKRFIIIKNKVFSVSKYVIRAIKENDLAFLIIEQKGKQTFFLKDSCISSFFVAKTNSSNNYVRINDSAKLRVNNSLFNFVHSHSHSVQSNDNRVEPKNLLDQFFTKPIVAKFCVSKFLSLVLVKKDDLLIEPSAGSGSFLKYLDPIDCKKYYIDIDPKNNEIEKADFLNWQPKKITGKIHVVGNPPFGKNGALCHNFINHSASFAETIAFVLPCSFNKDSVANKIPLNFDLIFSENLEKNCCFGTSAKCVFQIWQRTDKTRLKKKLTRKHKDFEFLKVNDFSASFCLRSKGPLRTLGTVCKVAIARETPERFH